ncbi:hypothetical protein ACLOJK_025033 [Asimina triloba]
MQVAMLSQLSLPSPSVFLSLCILFTFPYLLHYPIQLFFLLLSQKHFSWRSNSPFESSSSSHEGIVTAGELCVRRFDHVGEQEKCIVCLGKIAGGDEVRELRCCHLFHKACLDQWLGYRHSTCPICRCTLRPRQELDVGDKEEVLEELWGVRDFRELFLFAGFQNSDYYTGRARYSSQWPADCSRERSSFSRIRWGFDNVRVPLALRHHKITIGRSRFPHLK